MKYTRIPVNTFKNLQLNAGILATAFTPDTGEVKEEDLLGATNGGINFTATPEFSDFGEGIDNAPTNVMQLKRQTSTAASMTGSFVAVNLDLVQKLVGASDVVGNKIVPRNDLKMSDFFDLWLIADYSAVNEDSEDGAKAGYIAIHMMNTLSTGGFQIQTTNKDKGSFSFTFTAHYDMEKQDTVPYEVYVAEGSDNE